MKLYDSVNELRNRRLEQGWTPVKSSYHVLLHEGRVWLNEHAGQMVGSMDLTDGEDNGEWDNLIGDEVVIKNVQVALMFKLIFGGQ